MRKIFSICLPLFLLCVSVSAAPLRVLSAAPKGNLQEAARQAVSVTFNQPVVALAEQSQFDSADCALKITPAVAGKCRYAGTQTLVFEPTEDWPKATSFSVRIPAGFTSEVSGEKLGKDYTFSFTTSRPQVRQVYPRKNEHWLTTTPTLLISFNLPVSASLAAKQIHLADNNGEKISLSAREATNEEKENNFYYLPTQAAVLAFTPKRPLQKGTTYTVVIPAGLKSSVGPLGMEKDYTSTFVTAPDLRVLGVENKGCLPYTPQVRFSSPVRMRELIAAIKVLPDSALKTLDGSESDALGREVVISPWAQLSDYEKKNYASQYTLTPDEQKQGTAFFATGLPFLHLPPHQPVTVTIDKNLTDIYGNRLGQDYSFTITNDGYCPAVDFSGGYGVLESYLPPRLPIEVVNTPSLEVQAARFNKENYIAFLSSKPDKYCAQTPLSAPTYSGPYTFQTPADKSVKTYIDLSRFSPNAEDSLLFTQLKMTRHDKPCWVSFTGNITDVGILFKTSPENILLWATSLQTAEPLANLAVELRDSSNTVLWSGSTDMNGLARAPGWEQLNVQKPDWGAPKLYAFVSSAGGDGFVSTELNDGLEPWRFNLSYTYNPQQEAWRTLLFTERGIYRPGETVYLKGIVRRWKQSAWKVPSALTGKLIVSDAAGKEIETKTVTTDDAFGTFAWEFVLPTSAHNGTWDISFVPQIPGEKDPASTSYSFQVETAKPAEFTVTLQTDKPGYFSGETAQFSAAANYQFGTPLVAAPARFTLRREMAWFNPDGFDGYNFSPYFLREGEYKEDGKLLTGATQNTDDKGFTSFSAVLPQVSFPVRVFAEVGVQSPAKQDLFARQSVLLHPASFYLGVKTPDSYAKALSPYTVDVAAVTPEGKRTTASNVTAQIRRVEWHSVRKVGLSGRLEWVNSKEEIELPNQTFDVPQDSGKFTFVPPQSGQYHITLLTTDEEGRFVTGGFDVMVYGKDGPAWAQEDDSLLVLTQDKNTYQAGETARIHVASPYDNAQALVTVEREGVLDAWTTTVKGGADYVEVPIKANYLPNVYVSVTLIKGRSGEPVNAKGVDLGKPQAKTGYVNLLVTPQSKKLDVAVKTAKTEYRPGQEVRVKLTTKLGGKGMPAQVTLYAVDEGMLALTDYKTPNVFEWFYGRRPLSVFTADNRSYVIGQRNFGEKGENRGGGGSAYAKLGGVDLRSNFSFVPFYSAQVVTDKKGRAEVKFKLPDNLTKFRIMAVAVREQDFGSAQTQINVSKPLMITAQVPQTVREKDEFSCRAVVYNYADKNGVLSVQAAAQGSVQLLQQTSQTVTVPIGQAKSVSWPCVAKQTGNAQIVFSVKGRKENDGVSTQVKVSTVEKIQTLALYNHTADNQAEVTVRPSNTSANVKNQITVSLASTALLNIKGALTYLMTYPYECLEQQMSKIRPVITSHSLITDFKLGDVTQLKKRAQEILTQLDKYQHFSGGLGYWPNSLPDPYVTSYALETAYLAKQAGLTVPQQTVEEALAWLEKAFAKNQTLAFRYSSHEVQTARAYSTYVLALYGKPADALFNGLYAQYAALPLQANVYLLKAANVLNRPESVQEKLAQVLRNHIVHTPQFAYFSVNSPRGWLHQSDVTATANVLEALLVTRRPFAQAPQAAAWLLSQRNAQGHWNSTSENAAVLSALQTYEKTVENQTPDFIARVLLNGEEKMSTSFQGRQLTQTVSNFPFSEVYAKDNTARFNFAKTGVGTLFYTLVQTYEPASYDTPLSAGLEISRQITTLDGAPVTQLKAGQRYYVTLTVRTTAPRHFVVAEDYIPAGAEVVNTSLATEQTVYAGNDTQPAFNRIERYDERVAAFADYLPAGTHTFTYMLSAVTDGTFAYPSAWASLMYDPALFGRTATQTLVIDK